VRFAQSIIECEIAVERPDATAEHVQKLMDLYTVYQSFQTYFCSGGYRALQLVERHGESIVLPDEVDPTHQARSLATAFHQEPTDVLNWRDKECRGQEKPLRTEQLCCQ